MLSNGTASAPAAFIFATLDGHIEAWSPKVDPLIGNAEDKTTVPGAGYAGLAIAPDDGGRLFAANFTQGGVDVFNSAFKQVKTAPWQFRDPRLPRGGPGKMPATVAHLGIWLPAVWVHRPKS